MIKSAVRRATFLLGTLAAILVACSSEDSGNPSTGATGGQSNDGGSCLCTPGAQVSCSCGDSTGYQVCDAACKSLGPCLCAEAGPGGSAGASGAAGAAGAAGATGGAAGATGGTGGVAGASGGSAGTGGAATGGAAGAAGAGGWSTLDECYGLGSQDCEDCVASLDSKGAEAWGTIIIEDMVCKNECRTNGSCKQSDCGDGMITLVIHNAICRSCVDALASSSTAAQEAQQHCSDDPVCLEFLGELAPCSP